MPYKFDQNLGRLSMNVSKVIGSLLEANFKNSGVIFKASEWAVLSYLYNLGPQNQKQLVEVTGKDKVAIKRIIDIFETEKYAHRKIETHDKRYRKVILTEKGKEFYLKLENIVGETLLLTTKDIDPQKLEICLEVLLSVSKNKDSLLKEVMSRSL